MATIMLVDRIGAVAELNVWLKKLQGAMIQMRAGYWPGQVAPVLNRTLGFKHDLTRGSGTETEKCFRNTIRKVAREESIDLSEKFGNQYVKEGCNLLDQDPEDEGSPIKESYANLPSRTIPHQSH